MKKKCIAAVTVSLVTLLVLAALTRLVMPKYMGSETEGALIAEYYDETTDHQVIFIGDCEIYENISPISIWLESGVTSFLRGCPQQTIWQSYYLLEETLNTETPDVVVFNVFSMKYDTPESTGAAEQREAYNRIALDGMRWSASKWNSILASMLDSESMLDYLFPLLRYHSRITELSSDDFTYFWSTDSVSYSGYYMRVDTLPTTEAQVSAKYASQIEPSSYEFGESSWLYLEKMRELCEEKGVTLILMKAPSVSEIWYDEWDTQIADYAAAHGLAYFNFLTMSDETGVDLYNDTYDGGLHLNCTGAEKMGTWFGRYFAELGLEDRRDIEPYATVWAEKTEIYDQAKAAQYAALSE